MQTAAYQKAQRRKQRKSDPEFLAKEAAYQRQYRAKVKQEVIEALGGKCSCCGETNPLFLSIDHVDGGGRKHRSLFGNNVEVYRDVKRQGYPKRKFRVMCFNCNLGRERTPDGRCPHESKCQGF